MIWITITLSIILLGFLFVSLRFKDIETPKYQVLQKFGKAEIRRYPSMILAQTSLKSGQYDGNQNNGFRTIASYIFGGNKSQQKIAMTAPVIMNMSDSTPNMSFVMPSAYQLNELPEPNSDAVALKEQQPTVLAVVSFGGFANKQKIQEHIAVLKQTLEEHQIQTKGDFLYMGYNSPWDVVGRRNEIGIEVIGF